MPDDVEHPSSKRCGAVAFGRAGKSLHLWRRLIVPLAVLVVAASVGGAVAWLQNAVPNFGCVEPGARYRSGQPGARALHVMHERYGIKTIVNLRSLDKVPEDRHMQEEIEFARQNNINLIFLPYRDGPTIVQARKFLRIMAERTNLPVLIHCAEGKERAGVMVAVYRMAVDGWTPERALAEMRTYGFEPEKQPEMTTFVEGYPEARMPMDAQYQGSSAHKH